MLSEKIALLRRRAGWSQEELAERLGVSRQAVSKWEGATSQPDLDRVLALSELFGVSTDYLLKDEPSDGSVVADIWDEDASPEPGAALEGEVLPAGGPRALQPGEVHRYLGNRRQCAPKVGRGVALCVASPAPMMALMGVYEAGWWPIPGEDLAIAVGVGTLLVMVALGVVQFVQAASRMSKYDYIDKKPFVLTDDLRATVEGERQDFRREQSRDTAEGVFLCVLSPVPVVVGSIIDDGGLLTLAGVAMLLAMVALGTFLFTRDGVVMDGFSKLLKEK